MTAVVVLRSAPTINHIVRRPSSIIDDAVVTKCGRIGFVYHDDGHRAFRRCHRCLAVEALEALNDR